MGSVPKFIYALERAKLYSGTIEDVEEEKEDAERILDSINDSIIHNLFINIIRIIEFFCAQLAIMEKKRKDDGGTLKLPKD